MINYSGTTLKSMLLWNQSGESFRLGFNAENNLLGSIIHAVANWELFRINAVLILEENDRTTSAFSKEEKFETFFFI